MVWVGVWAAAVRAAVRRAEARMECPANVFFGIENSPEFSAEPV